MIMSVARTVMGAIVVIIGLSLAACTGNRLDAPLDRTSTVLPSVVASTASATDLPDVTTETVTSVPSPTLAEGPTTFTEPFIDNRNNWYTNPTLVDILSGTYKHGLDCPASSDSVRCGYFIQIPFVFPPSFRMQMETTITSASAGAGVMVGFQLRRSDDGYYYVNYVVTKGLYEISRVTQTGAFPIVPETPTNLIEPGIGETNVLGIEINNAELMPLLNGNQIPPVHDGNIRTAGASYLVVLVERGHSAEIHFDNLVVEKIE
jgi:hypothetical protein